MQHGFKTCFHSECHDITGGTTVTHIVSYEVGVVQLHFQILGYSTLINAIEDIRNSATYLNTIESKQLEGGTSDLLKIVPSVFSHVASHDIHQLSQY